MPKYKVIISGGGTGGHIFPAIAIANAIKRIANDSEFLFVGAEGKMEMTKVPEAGYKIIGLPIMGLQRRLTLKNLSFPIKLIKSLLKARKIINSFNPDIVIGVGGYASGPLLWIASGKKIPTLIQEQNSYAGITNKLLGKRANRICVAYSGMEKYFPSNKIVLTGNPVRKEVVDSSINHNSASAHFGLNPDKQTILVIGGSLGARTINLSVKTHLHSISKSDIQVIWQTGSLFEKQANQFVQENQFNGVYVQKFIKEMGLAYAAADIIISRAGAISVSELTIIGKPIILIPSPNVAEDHQTKNAMALLKNEAAIMVKDKEAIDILWDEIKQLLDSKEKQTILSDQISKLGIRDADERIANEAIALIQSKSNAQ